MDDLPGILRALEVELHHPGVACDARRLEELLHPDFHEVGRSGRRYDRDTVLRYLGERAEPPRVVSDDFAWTPLAQDVGLLTYRSALQTSSGELDQHTFRSSVWMRVGGRWQLRYHQGTPAEMPRASGEG